MKGPKAIVMDSMVDLVTTIATIRMKTKARIENDLPILPRGDACSMIDGFSHPWQEGAAPSPHAPLRSAIARWGIAYDSPLVV
jgi:hypothetical protein